MFVCNIEYVGVCKHECKCVCVCVFVCDIEYVGVCKHDCKGMCVCVLVGVNTFVKHAGKRPDMDRNPKAIC